MDVNRPLTREEEEDLIGRAKNAATAPGPGLSIKDRKKAYMDNFRDEDGDDDDDKHRKYQEFVNEINGEDEDDDDVYALEDDISSLGLESNVASEANTPSYQNLMPHVSSRIDSTLNSITTIPEMTTPESTSSLYRMPQYIKEPSPVPSPKQLKQPRSQLLQQARPLSSASEPGQKKIVNRKASKNSRSSKAVEEKTEVSEDETSKARAREEFLASRRAMNTNAIVPDSSSVASAGSNTCNSVSTGISGGGKLRPKVEKLMSLSTVDSPTNETSCNSSFSTTNSAPSRCNNALPPTSPQLQKSISNGTVSSQQIVPISSHTQRSRDASPLPPLRHQPMSIIVTSDPSAVDLVDEKEEAASHRPFVPLTRNHTQVIDDKDVRDNKDSDDDDSDKADEHLYGNGIIETRIPAFFSPDEIAAPFSAGGDTFSTVESEGNFLSKHITPASHKKQFALNVENSPSGLLITQQSRNKQRSAERLTGTTRIRGSSSDDLYQPGSDDRSYRRASAAIVNPSIPVETVEQSLFKNEITAGSDQFTNVQDGMSTIVSPVVAGSQGVISAAGSPRLSNPTQLAPADNSKNLMRADIMRALFEEDTEAVYERLGDEPITSIFPSEADKQFLGRIYWQCLLMQRYQTILFLIDEAVVGIDAVCEDAGAHADQDGRSALHYAVVENAESFGRQLIRRGASIFLRDHQGESALSSSLKQGISWLLEEFQQSGEEVLADNGNDEDKFQYISHFILSGIPGKAKSLLASNKFTISVNQATTLLNACKGNFEQMDEPVETFELLMSLDAEMAD
jgi:hypothetical protein